MNEKLVYEVLASATVCIEEFENEVNEMIKELNDINKIS